MITAELSRTLTTLLSELVDGAPETGAHVLNGGDPGLLASLSRLPAAAASASVAGGGTIAAHADHLRYGISLMNRWRAGENPFPDANWSASWRITAVSDEEWRSIRTTLATEVHNWMRVLRTPREANATELNGVVGSVVHLAYHLGAIRQIDGTTGGPAERA